MRIAQENAPTVKSSCKEQKIHFKLILLWPESFKIHSAYARVITIFALKDFAQNQSDCKRDEYVSIKVKLLNFENRCNTAFVNKIDIISTGRFRYITTHENLVLNSWQ